MKAKKVIVKVPVIDNIVYVGGFIGTATTIKPADRYIDKEENHCPKCDALLQVDSTDNEKFYCWRCKEYGIERP
ncbi:MAG: hypothetical protein WC554_16290 [Clostridia bacterium]|jgi:hypothetical protein